MADTRKGPLGTPTNPFPEHEPAFLRHENPEFANAIASLERSAEHADYGYGQRNPRSNALGRYQLAPGILQDMGWRDAQGGWTDLAAQYGVLSTPE